MMRRHTALALVSGAIWLFGCRDRRAAAPAAPQIPAGEVWLSPAQAKEAKIETALIGERDVDDTILTSGRVTFDDLRVAHVYSPVSGRVVDIRGGARLGALVTKGEALAVIDSPEIGTAVSDLRKADAEWIAAEHDYKREKELAAKNAGLPKELEQAEDNVRKARVELSRARQKTNLLGVSALERAKGTLTLTSPIDGEVVARGISPGMEVQGQYSGGTVTELFTVGKLDKVWVVADLYEMDLARVHIGTKVLVKVASYKDRVFEAKVDWVSGMLDAATRTAKVRCTFENPCADAELATGDARCRRHLLKPEMYATVQLSVDEKRALAIPRNSILRLGEQTVVFVDVGKTPDGQNRYERVPVVVDEGEGSSWVTVQNGLRSGAKVVTNGAILLSAKL